MNKFVVPELDKCVGVDQNEHHKDDVFTHICEVVKNTAPNLTARLAAVFHDIGKPDTKSIEDGKIHFYGHEDLGADIATHAMKRLRYPLDITGSVSKIVKNHMRLKAAGADGQGVGDKALRRFMSELGDNLEPALQMMHGDNISHHSASSMPNQISFLKHRMDNLQGTMSLSGNVKSPLPINGNDIMKTLGIKPGPAVRQLLAVVQDAWYENPNLTADDALLVVRREYEKLTGGEESNTDVMNQTVKNPETGNDILVKTALKYDETHPAYKNAMALVQRSNSG
jgi:putative nucleotidyltransferase with HDIG domain